MTLCRYETNLNSAKFSWNSVDSVLMPKCIVTLPEMCTATCGYKKNALEDVSAAREEFCT